MKKATILLSGLWLALTGYMPVAEAQCIRPVVISDAATVCPGGQTTLSAAPGDYWTAKNSLTMVHGIQPAVTFSVGGTGYFTVGLDNGYYVPGTWAYDTLTDTWTQKADFAGSIRTNATGFSLQGAGYVAGGANGVARTGELWRYDPIANAWTQKASLPGGYGVSNAMSFTIGNIAWLAGGSAPSGSSTAVTASVWSYDPAADQWTSRAPLPVPLANAAAFGIGGKGFIVMGDNDNNTGVQPGVYAYDPVTDSWSAKNNFPATARSRSSSFTIGNRGFVFGGFDAAFDPSFNELWEYDPAGDSWTMRAAIPGGAAEGRTAAPAFSIGGKAWLFGGWNGADKNDVWEYTPALAYRWSNGATSRSVSVPAGTYTVTATDVGDCSQTSASVTIGEKSAPAVIPSAVPVICPGQSLTLYGDTANYWTQQDNLPAAGAISGVSFTIGSKGYTGAGSVRSDWWEYDDITGVWTQKADVPGPGRIYATGFAINGKGYVGIGSGPGIWQSDFWEFDPYANTWTAKAPFPGGPTNGAVGFVIGSLGYVGLGQSNAGYATDFWSFDPVLDRWSPIAAFPGSGRREAMGFSLDGKGYVTCGWANQVNNVNDCWQYDPVTNAWSAQASLPGAPRRTSAVFTLQDHAYLVGGYSTDNLAECWEFHNGTWTAKPAYPGPAQWGMSGMGFHDHGLVFFGASGTQGVWRYHPNTTLQWPDGSTQLSFTVSSPGVYSAKVVDIGGCATPTDALTVTAQSFSASIASSGPTTFCEGLADTLSANGDVWTKKGEFPGGNDWYATGFSLGPAGYFCGGWNNRNQLWKFDAATETWSQQAATPAQVLTTSAWPLDGKAYLLSPIDKFIWVYDPTYNTWTRKAAFPGGEVSQAIQGFLLNGLLYAAGGTDAAINPIAEVWAYDPAADTWTRKHDMPYAMAFAPAFALNGKGYLCTGNSSREAGNGQSAIFMQYDPAADAWTLLPDFPGGPRGAATAFTDGHRAYVGLGNHGPSLTDLWQWDPATGQWTRMADIPVGRYAAASFVLGHYAYVATGVYNGNYNNDVWRYEMPYLYRWSTGETTRSIKVTGTGDYSVTVSSYEGCSAAGSAVHITSEATTVIGSQPENVTVCAPAAASFSVNATGTGLSYQWLLNGSPLSDGGVYSGAQTPQLSISNTDGLDGAVLTNIVTGVCGVDTTVAAKATVHPLPATPVIGASGPTMFCEGGSVTLNGPAAAAYAWSNGAATPNIVVTTPGIYRLVITDSNGCRSAASDADTVKINPYPAGSIQTEGPILSGSSHIVQLTAPSSPGDRYLWSTGAVTPVIQVSQSGDYRVEVTTEAGCSTTFDVSVQLIDWSKIPNTFSPNHDGINDTWYIKALDAFPEARVLIFNRDGSKVFEARNPGIKWDGNYGGRELPAGVYYYVIDLKDGSKPVTGWINLVR